MEDERRKFLQGLLALGGGAAVLPELVQARRVSHLSVRSRRKF